MNETLITGLMPVPNFLFAILLACIGAFVNMLLKANDRPAVVVIKGEAIVKVQTAWSWNHLWNDNTKKLVLSLLLIYLAIRFLPLIVSAVLPGTPQAGDNIGTQATEWAAVVIGFSLDKVAQFFKSLGTLGQKPPEVKEKTQDLKEVASVPPNPPIS